MTQSHDTTGGNALSFSFPTHALRVEMIDGEPWFVASDVCESLGLDDTSKACSRLDDDEKLTRTMFVSGQNREVLIINESGLYSLILTSRKPEAKKFKKWVTADVLPAIRKTGRYESAQEQVITQEVARLQQLADDNFQTALEFQQECSNLRAQLYKSQGGQIKLLNRIITMQYRHSRREAVRMAEDMKRQGASNEAIQQATGLNNNYLKQVFKRARDAGRLPPLLKSVVPEGAQATLDLQGA